MLKEEWRQFTWLKRQSSKNMGILSYLKPRARVITCIWLNLACPARFERATYALEEFAVI
jgi:hypothetical protein